MGFLSEGELISPKRRETESQAIHSVSLMG